MKSKLCVLVFILAVVLPVQAFASAKITLLHINDLHGQILPRTDKTINAEVQVGDAAVLAAMIGKARAGNPGGTVLLAAGDMFLGSPVSTLFRGKPVIEVMNLAGFDAMAVGNHEFDWGTDAFRQMQTSARFPFLSANIVNRLTGQVPEGIRKYVLLERKGIRLAVIGLTTPDAAFTVKPDKIEQLRFIKPARALPQIIREVKRNGADLVIVLSHLGFDSDRKLARSVKGINVIVGGHSHTAVEPPFVEKGVVIVQAGSYGCCLGVLELTVDERTKKIVKFTAAGELQPVLSGPGAPREEKAVAIVAHFYDKIKGELSRVVGETRTNLIRRYEEESSLGNLISDAMRKSARAEIAFQNPGGIRAHLPRGKINLEQLYTMLPFENTIRSMDLTGEQVISVLEQSASLKHGILQVSGMRAIVDPSRPEGERVIKVEVGGKKIDRRRLYRVATNDYLAAGGDGFRIFKEGKRIEFGDDLLDAAVSYIRAHSPLNGKEEGRIIVRRPRR